MVVTNPPFSLFREYITQLAESGKKFLVLGDQNAITYDEVFAQVDGRQPLVRLRERRDQVVPGAGRLRHHDRVEEEGRGRRQVLQHGPRLLVHQPRHHEAPRGHHALQALHARGVPDLHELPGHRGPEGLGHPDGLRRRDGRPDHLPGQVQPGAVRDPGQQPAAGRAHVEVRGTRDVRAGGPRASTCRRRTGRIAACTTGSSSGGSEGRPREDRAQRDHGSAGRRGLPRQRRGGRRRLRRAPRHPAQVPARVRLRRQEAECRHRHDPQRLPAERHVLGRHRAGRPTR